MYFVRRLKVVLFAVAVLWGGVAVRAVEKPPVITHDPVTCAVRGQSLTLKAKVTQEKPGVQSVTLYYALFSDAAPFRVPMKAAGLDVYVGTIDATMLRDVDKIAYYIEAQDMNGATTETPWYNVVFKKADASTPVTNETPGTSGAAADTNSHWETYALIGGGAAAVLGGAIIVANSGGGSSGGGTAVSTNSYTGTYSGTAAKCLTLSGQTPSCESHPVTFQVDSKNAILSQDLDTAGTPLTANVDNSGNFFMSLPVSGSNFVSGVINFNGTIINGQISGQISGSVTTTNSAGVYQGNFSAAKQ